MTGSRVERIMRTAHPAPSGSPAGVSPLMPPHSQGAERRTERRTRTTGIRWGVRTLVIGGLAGAAWLLTGVAAHAADPGAEPVGPACGTVADGDDAVVASGPPVREPDMAAGILELPHRVPVRSPGEVVRGHRETTVDIVVGDVDPVPREVAAAPRLTGGSADLQPRITAVPALLPRISSLSGADPVGEHPVVRRPGDERPAGVLPVAEWPHRPAVTPGNAVVRAGSPRVHQAFRTGRSTEHGKVAHRRSAVTSVTADEPVPRRWDTSGGGGPAVPPRPHLSEAGGRATLGPATWMEGGCAAFRPAAIADRTMACHRLPIATDVEIRRHDAEAPTVSPD